MNLIQPDYYMIYYPMLQAFQFSDFETNPAVVTHLYNPSSFTRRFTRHRKLLAHLKAWQSAGDICRSWIIQGYLSLKYCIIKYTTKLVPNSPSQSTIFRHFFWSCKKHFEMHFVNSQKVMHAKPEQSQPRDLKVQMMRWKDWNQTILQKEWQARICWGNIRSAQNVMMVSPILVLWYIVTVCTCTYLVYIIYYIDYILYYNI